jgi:hypothetical protein
MIVGGWNNSKNLSHPYPRVGILPNSQNNERRNQLKKCLASTASKRLPLFLLGEIFLLVKKDGSSKTVRVQSIFAT